MKRLTTCCAPLILLLGGCASMNMNDVKHDADQVKVSANALVQAARAHAEAVWRRQQRYLAEHEVLKTFEDAGEHSESEVLKVLHAARARAVVPAASDADTDGARPTAYAAGRPSGVAKVPRDLVASGAPLHGDAAHADAQLRWPVEAGVISSSYGERWGKMHKGLDIAADTGEPVLAVADGDVIYAGDGLRGYGNVVIIRHGERLSSLYAHNSELKVKQGDHVHGGMLVALMGSTGHSTGPHVHFELRRGDVAVNPRTLLPQTTLADASPGADARRVADVGTAPDASGRGSLTAAKATSSATLDSRR